MRKVSVVLAAIAGFATIAASAALAGGASFGDGAHVVGKDVRPGTYRARGGDGCYWERLRDFRGGLNSILANENASGPTLVTILPTDKGFQSSNCGTWTSNLHRITKSTTRFGNGKYLVRVDVAPGTYRSAGGSGCYWERLRDFTGGLNSILANDNPTGSAIVTISASDKGFHSDGCATWSRL